MDINGILFTTVGCTVFASVPGTFKETAHKLGYKDSINKSERISITQLTLQYN